MPETLKVPLTFKVAEGVAVPIPTLLLIALIKKVGLSIETFPVLSILNLKAPAVLS